MQQIATKKEKTCCQSKKNSNKQKINKFANKRNTKIKTKICKKEEKSHLSWDCFCQ